MPVPALLGAATLTLLASLLDVKMRGECRHN